jgi:hypothetical protein
MTDSATIQRVLHSPFDLDTHKATFVDYLEVCVSADGVIHYAVPSHTAFVENYLAEHLHKTVQDVRALCPREQYCDYAQWLCNTSGCIMLWDNHIIHPNECTAKQVLTLHTLIKQGLYRPQEGMR